MSQSTMNPLVVASINSTATLPQEGSHSLEFAEVFSKHLKAQTDSSGDSFFHSQASPGYFAPCTNESSPSQNAASYFSNKLQSLSPLTTPNPCVPSSRCSSGGSGSSSSNSTSNSGNNNNSNNNTSNNTHNNNGNSVNIPCNITLSVASADWTAQLTRCLNKLVNKMEAQRIQLLQLSSRLHPLIYNGTNNEPSASVIANESKSCSMKGQSIEPVVSNCTFASDQLSPGSNLGAPLQYKERLEHLQDVLNQQWMELECLKRSCSEYHGRMNLLKGSHSMAASHLQPVTVMSSVVESNHHLNHCEATTATSALPLLAYPSSTSCISSTAQLISNGSSHSQVIHAPTAVYSSNSGGNCSSFTPKVNVECGKDVSPEKEEAKSHATTEASYIKSEGSSDSRDSGITSELSS